MSEVILQSTLTCPQCGHGVLNGVLIAVVLSLVFLLKQAATPHIAILGQIPGTTNYSDMQRHLDNIPVEGVLILRIEASVLYFNANNIHYQIHRIVEESPGQLKLVVMHLSSANYVDVSGARFFLHLEDDLEKKGIGLLIVDALGQARDILRAEGMEKEIGHISRKVTINDVVTTFQNSKTQIPNPSGRRPRCWATTARSGSERPRGPSGRPG